MTPKGLDIIPVAQKAIEEWEDKRSTFLGFKRKYVDHSTTRNNEGFTRQYEYHHVDRDDLYAFFDDPAFLQRGCSCFYPEGIAVSHFISGLRTVFMISFVFSLIAAIISYLRGPESVWNRENEMIPED